MAKTASLTSTEGRLDDAIGYVHSGRQCTSKMADKATICACTPRPAAAAEALIASYWDR
jgi:hypothetical protein